MSELTAPSPWFRAHEATIRAAATRGPLLDLACGRGRHAVACAERGAHTVGLDRNAGFLRELADRAKAADLPLQTVRCDVEETRGLPLARSAFACVLVFRFLDRKRSQDLIDVLQPGGILVYETFTIQQRELGYGPKNPAFLLEPQELQRMFGKLETLAYEELRTDLPRPESLARLVARKT